MHASESWPPCNLVPRVLSLPRESTLVMAGHVSIHANYRRTEGGSSTNFNFNFNFPAPPFDHISGICWNLADTWPAVTRVLSRGRERTLGTRLHGSPFRRHFEWRHNFVAPRASLFVGRVGRFKLYFSKIHWTSNALINLWLLLVLVLPWVKSLVTSWKGRDGNGWLYMRVNMKYMPRDVFSHDYSFVIFD